VSDSSEIRVSDAERESALSALGTHMSTGRIDVDEFSERSAQVAAARTRGDLILLFADLPEPQPDFGSEDRPESPPPRAPDVISEPRPVVRHSQTGKRLAVGTAVATVAVALVVFVITHLWLLLAIPVGLAIIGAIVWAASRVRGSWFEDSEFDAEFDKQFNARYSMHDPSYSKNYIKHYLRNYMRKYGERYDPRGTTATAIADPARPGSLATPAGFSADRRCPPGIQVSSHPAVECRAQPAGSAKPLSSLPEKTWTGVAMR